MRRTKTLLVSTALGLSLVLSACGGGDDGGSDAGGTESSSESSESPTEAESPAETPTPTESDEASPESAAYCEDLSAAQEQFTTLSQGDVGQFEKAISTLRDLSDAAPSVVASDWEALLVPLNKLESALSRAGLKFEDLEGLSQGQIPRGVDPQQLQKLGTELQGLASAEVNEAGAAIEEHAASECDIQLGQ